MPSLFGHSLVAVALLSLSMVEAAPAATTTPTSVRSVEKRSATTVKTTKARTSEKSLKRGKRQIVVEEVPVEEVVGDVEEVQPYDDVQVLKQQLEQLSDDQLLLLAEIVQSEIDKYDPTRDAEVYEPVELPDYVTLGRNRRSIPVEFEEVQPFEEYVEEPEEVEVMVVPESAIVAALEEKQREQSELELEERIAEVANILNERASRGVRAIRVL